MDPASPILDSDDNEVMSERTFCIDLNDCLKRFDRFVFNNNYDPSCWIQSDPDVLELDTDYDLPVEQDCPTTTAVSHNIGSIWRDMVVGEQMEGCLTRLEVTTKTAGYTDMDDPNYTPT